MAIRSGARALVLFTAVACMSSALADISDSVYTVEISRQVEGGEVTIGYYAVDASQGTWDPETGEFSWYLDQDVILTDFAGAPVGTLQAYDEATGLGSHLTVTPAGGRSPYQLNLGFAVQAGNALTSFSFGSALVSFPTIANPQGYVDGVINLTDFNGDGATLTGLQPGGGVVRAVYDADQTFAELFVAPIAAGPFDSTSVNDSYGYAQFGQPASSIRALVDFSLTAEDLASGTVNYVVIPEPAAALLLLASLVFRRR